MNLDRAGKVAVLIVDEAHKLSAEVLEEIRLLTNFETDDNKLLQIVLAGQTELGDLLNRQELRQLKQRVAVRLEIGPLTAADLASTSSSAGRLPARPLPCPSLQRPSMRWGSGRAEYPVW